jgi:glucose-1-phosphate cytidylyltransferase
MKVIILAGGFGTRLGNRTTLIPKPMVKIGGKPILWHIMKIYSHYGQNEFIICLGHRGEVIKDYFLHYNSLNNDFTINTSNSKIDFHSDSGNENWKVTLVDTGINTLKGSRIKRIEKYLDEDINLLTYGDGVADINLDELIEFHKNHGGIITITGVNPPSRFGDLIEENGVVKNFTEKAQASQGLINGGFMVFDGQFLDYLTPEGDCDLERGVLADLAEEGKVRVYKHKGRWECMDHERDINHLEKLWSENKAFWKVWK